MINTTHTEVLYEEALNKAKAMYASGENNRYIELQLAEKKYSDSIIDRVINQIQLIRKTEKKKKGIQKLISGSTIILVSFLVTWLSFNSDSPIGIFMAGTGIVGVFITVRGLWDFLGFE